MLSDIFNTPDESVNVNRALFAIIGGTLIGGVAVGLYQNIKNSFIRGGIIASGVTASALFVTELVRLIKKPTAGLNGEELSKELAKIDLSEVDISKLLPKIDIEACIKKVMKYKASIEAAQHTAEPQIIASEMDMMESM